MILAASLRIHTFYLPHNHGDQIFFLGLAMKMEKLGLSGYNLSGIDISKANHLLFFSFSKEGDKGSILRSLEKDNVFYYSKETLSNMPPAFSFLLMKSHKLFSPKEPFMTVASNLGPFSIFIRPEVFLKSQFYAVLPNFLFSIFFILLVFLLGKLFFNENTALWASILIAVSSVDILTSQRIWTDEMVSFFTILAVIFFWVGLNKDRILFFVLSGIFSGVAALTKQSGIFIVLILALSFILIRLNALKREYFSFKNIFDKRLIFFVISAFLVSFFWYFKITKTYGAPWYMPYQEGIEKVASWFVLLNKRPRYGQIYYFVFLCPIFALFYIESAKIILRKIFTPQNIICLVWFSVHITMLMIIPAKEERYMLPAYPAIAMLSGILIENIRTRLNDFRGASNLGNLTVIFLIFASSAWSIGLGLECLFNNCAMFDMF